MTVGHTGNIQPQIDNEEHTHLSGVAGKKVFVMDDSGNVITSFSNPTVAVGSSATVYVVAKTTPSSQASVVIDNGTSWVGLATVNVANSQATIDIRNVVNSLATVTYSGNATIIVSNELSGLVTVQNSQTTVYAYGIKSVLQQDTQTWALNVIDYGHHEVHAGSHFYIKDWLDIPASTTREFLFITPDTTKWAHVRWGLAAEAEGTFTLFENCVTNANGSGVTIYNNNRNSTTVSTIAAYATPSLASTGQQIYSAKLGSGRSIGAEQGREHEMVAKQNTKYLVRLSNDDGTATRWFGYDFFWYEHIDKV